MQKRIATTALQVAKNNFIPGKRAPTRSMTEENGFAFRDF